MFLFDAYASISKVTWIDRQRVMVADLKNDDERDRKESNEGCQDAAEARASARARNESSTRRLSVISRLRF